MLVNVLEKKKKPIPMRTMNYLASTKKWNILFLFLQIRRLMCFVVAKTRVANKKHLSKLNTRPYWKPKFGSNTYYETCLFSSIFSIRLEMSLNSAALVSEKRMTSLQKTSTKKEQCREVFSKSLIKWLVGYRIRDYCDDLSLFCEHLRRIPS